MNNCPNCGEILNDGVEFCPRCGVRVGAYNAQISCPRCGEPLGSNERFCHRCGLSLVGGQPTEDNPKKTSSSHPLLAILLVLCILGGAYYVFFKTPVASVIGTEDEHITFVKNGSPVDYPDVTYDEAFSAFFSNRSWEYFVSDTGKDVVEFKGDCLYHDTQVTATIQFVLDMDEGTFEFEYLAFNDVPQSILISYALITKVFEDYQ